MINFSKTTLLLIFLIIFIITTTGVFVYQWWQGRGESAKQIEKTKKAEVTITTDKTEYRQGEIVKIIIKNNSEKTLIDGGLQIQKYEDDKWIYAGGAPFSPLCPCGAACEIELPTFIVPEKVMDTEWDQNIIWCEGNLEKRKKSLGKYRFKLGHTEDKAKCNKSVNPLSCLIKRGGIIPEEWRFTYSNEFIIK